MLLLVALFTHLDFIGVTCQDLEFCCRDGCLLSNIMETDETQLVVLKHLKSTYTKVSRQSTGPWCEQFHLGITPVNRITPQKETHSITEHANITARLRRMSFIFTFHTIIISSLLSMSRRMLENPVNGTFVADFIGSCWKPGSLQNILKCYTFSWNIFTWDFLWMVYAAESIVII